MGGEDSGPELADTLVGSGAPVHEPSAPPLPDLGPKYRVVRLLGRGGMGAVYEAEHVALRRMVAVKRLAPAFIASERAIERLRREAESASRIGHPNIVQVVDFDVAPDGLPFVVMERLEGEDLRRRLEARGRLSPAETVAVVVEVCAALSAAHERGILHRDIKPENIFLARMPAGSERAESVKLVDFGLALTDEGRKLTVDGEFVGTPAYLAPEQVAGERASERTDVYAAALLAYECLSGVAPFEAEGLASTMARVLHHDPVPPTQAGAPTASKLLDGVVLKGIEKDPAKRWPSAEALSTALRDALAGQRVAGAASASFRRALRSRRGRFAVAVPSVVALAAALSLAWPRPPDRTSEPPPVAVARLLERVGQTGESMNEILAAEMLAREAVRRAPDLAAARVALSKVLLAKARLGARDQIASLRESERSVRRALELDPRSEPAHLTAAIVSYALVHDVDSLREIAWVDRNATSDAVRVAVARHRARIAWRLGQTDAIVRELDRCLALDPREGECLDLRLKHAAQVEGRSALARTLADSSTEPHLALWGRVHARALGGRIDEAELLYEGGLRGAGAIDVVDRPYFEGMIALGRGDRAAAVRHLTDLERAARAPDLVPATALSASWQAAELSALLGDADRVVTWAREALGRGFCNGGYWSSYYLFELARRDGRLARIADEAERRGDARWAEARRLGLVE